jgi:hypothetical protein
MKYTLALVLIALLAACGSDAPPEQTREETPTLSGTAAYDARVTASEVTSKGANGPTRTASNSSGTNQYSVSLLQLSAPYALRWLGEDSAGAAVSLYSAATRQGVANVTPLTTLVMAQLLGQEPGSAFTAFGSTGGVNIGLVTDANLEEAQRKVTVYLRDVMGVEVRANAGNFITAPFQARTGDPMYDTIAALNAKLVADGISFDTLATRVATLARLCIEEKIEISIGSERKEFCPAAKVANPQEETDPPIFDYVFTSPTNDSLTVRLQDEAVLSAEYVSTGGQTFSCTGTACGSIRFGAPAADLTRNVTFTLAQLNGSSGPAVLNGSLRGAIPGIALPILPCDNNKYYAILPDRRVFANCVDTGDPVGAGGILNFTIGAEPSRAQYQLAGGATQYPERPAVEVITDANDSILSVVFTLLDEDGFPTVQYYCMRSACNGVTLGPVTTNTELDPFTLLIRRVTFENTTLTGVNPDGTPTGNSATLKASFTSVYFNDETSPLRFPDLADCSSPSVDVVGIEVLSGPFNFCTDAGAREIFATPDSDAIELRMSDEMTGNTLSVHVLDGEVISVTYDRPVSQQFRCDANCTGVTVTGPDENGERIVTFDGTVLYEAQWFPVPGERTATLDGGPLTFPPL